MDKGIHDDMLEAYKEFVGKGCSDRQAAATLTLAYAIRKAAETTHDVLLQVERAVDVRADVDIQH